MIKNKIIAVFLCLTLFITAFAFSASAAGSYTEYYQYNGQAISTAVSDVLAGYAINSIRQFPDYYRYWFAFRLDEYRYAIVLMPDAECYNMNTSTMIGTVDDGIMIVYNQRLASYNTGSGYNQTYYQAGLEPTTILVRFNKCEDNGIGTTAIAKYLTKYITKDLTRILKHYYYAGGHLNREVHTDYRVVPFDSVAAPAIPVKNTELFVKYQTIGV